MLYESLGYMWSTSSKTSIQHSNETTKTVSMNQTYQSISICCFTQIYEAHVVPWERVSMIMSDIHLTTRNSFDHIILVHSYSCSDCFIYIGKWSVSVFARPPSILLVAWLLSLFLLTLYLTVLCSSNLLGEDQGTGCYCQVWLLHQVCY